ncbi:hypothetical protein CALVIDRAFT_538845 [Calocera viscosa TUFC12733]|uniref:Transmembrane protein n=1 Tax=Calocera viscosa (strain TUFC12733) TaxID=1330018 RepID=A0A167KKK9_CALVF|nr:hypothetical protein CALVIDRAFT_538845 [Calocera viscosa TUFC12733]
MFPRPLPRPSTSRLPPILLARPSPIARRTFLRQPKVDPSVPPTYAQLEHEARIGRLRVVVVTLPLIVVCGCTWAVYFCFLLLALREDVGLARAPEVGESGNVNGAEPPV